jgi:integrase
LEAKRIKADSGELSEGAWAEYARIGKRILGVFGRQRLVDDLTPADFSRLRKDFAQTAKSLNSINTYITTTRTFFNFAHREGLIDHPIRYGDAFARPTRTALRRQRQQRPPRLFDASQIHTLLDAAKPQMRAMILLGINCGFGNNDCILLTMRMLDLPVGWIHSPRSKTTIMRHCPLWPETANALQHVLQHREDPIDCQHADRVFIIRQMPWHSKRLRGNLVSDTFTTLQKKTKLRLPGLNFYALRHTFATIGKQTKDNDAVRAILGHVIPANDMLSNNYDEAPVEQHRLLAVSSYVLAWLYPTGE